MKFRPKRKREEKYSFISISILHATAPRAATSNQYPQLIDALWVKDHFRTPKHVQRSKGVLLVILCTSLNREPISDQKIVTRFFLQKLSTFLSE